MAAPRPPLDLTVALTRADGTTFLWGPGARVAGDVPKGLMFRTRRGDGFADASLNLSRRIDRDYVDLNLLDDVRLFGTGGGTGYEGRVASLPRSLSGGHVINVQAVGWMAHAKDRKFREIYVDRDLSRWQGPSVQRQLDLLTAGGGGNGWRATGPETVDDPAGGGPALRTGVVGSWAASNPPDCEAWYDARGIPIEWLYYAWKRNANVSVADAAWVWGANLCDTATATIQNASGNLHAAGPGQNTLQATGVKKFFAQLQLYYNYFGGPAGGDGTPYDVYWTVLAVFGAHGLPRYPQSGGFTSVDAPGLYASDVIKDIASRWCPRLSTAGVQSTDYPLRQLTFFDRIYPYDAWLQINNAHRWNLSVWEDKTLTYSPVDLTDYDWEVRLSDPGVEVELQGDSTENLANGIAVNYTDVVTGQPGQVTPDDTSALRDSSVENPANQHGLDVWTELDISFPVTKDMAVQFGRAALAEFNAPKAPGTIKATGHVRDRAGHWQPVWKVRADDRIAITDHPNARPRLIVETEYQHDDKSIQIGVDAPLPQIDAVFDRITSSLAARGLST